MYIYIYILLHITIYANIYIIKNVCYAMYIMQ